MNKEMGKKNGSGPEVIVSGINKKGLKETLDQTVVHECIQCPYNQLGGHIIRYRRIREGKMGMLFLSSDSTDLYFRCSFDKTDCPDLESEKRKAKQSSMAPTRSFFKGPYEFDGKRKIIDERGYNRLVSKVTERIK